MYCIVTCYCNGPSNFNKGWFLMYQLVFIVLMVSKTGMPTFNIEHVSTFATADDCLKSKLVMQEYVDNAAKDGKVFRGIFECRATVR